MDGRTRQTIKAYINPQMVNQNFLNAAWNRYNNQIMLQNSNKIHINPNFKRSDSASVNNKSRQVINHVHINPNFLNQQTSKGVISENNLVTESKAVIGSVDSKLVHSHNYNNNKTKINIKVIKDDAGCSSRVCDNSNSLKNSTVKNSLYSWRKTGNDSSVVANKNKFALNRLVKNQSSSRYKFIKGKKNQTPVKSSPFLNHIHLVYASKTKIINKRLSNYTTLANESRINQLDKRKLLNRKKLLLMGFKSFNIARVSPTVKIAASVRSKYKYTNKLINKNKLSLKNINVKSSKFKLDKRKISHSSVKRKSIKSRYKIGNLFPNKYKVDPRWPRTWRKSSVHSWKRKEPSVISRKNVKRYPNRTVVKIGGILYKSSQSKLTRTRARKKSVSSVKEEPRGSKNKSLGKGNHIVYVRGEKFILDRSGKSLKRHPNQEKIPNEKKINIKRIDIGGVTYLRKSNNVLIRTNTHHARYVVNHAKQKSIALLSSLRKRNYMPCMIYSRLGKCARHEKGLCAYTHDKKNIALCKKFLKGECQNKSCPLSHDLVQEKMATCHFFLKGCCTNENCPYLHVKVNSKAPICKDFIQGFCNLGKDCIKRHVNLCPEYDQHGKCSKGDKCLYPHESKSKNKIKKNKTWRKSKTNSGKKVQKIEPKEKKTKRLLLEKEDSAKENERKLEMDHEFVPKRIKLHDLPCFIPLDSSKKS